MRTSDIAYVKNPPMVLQPSVDLQDMDLEEIKNKYLKTCLKSGGDPAKCSKCGNPCVYGKRAMQLIANEIYSNPPIPLYGGKTLIERAREENMKRRQAEEEKKQKEQQKEETKKIEKKRVENWWEDSLASGDQIEWLCSHLNMSKTQAKKKVYNYKYLHGLLQPKTPEPEKSTVITKQPNESEESRIIEQLENKINKLMKQQDEYKSLAERYQKLYQETKTKTDALFEALNILNE